jgi:single-strand DNA-binding protein
VDCTAWGKQAEIIAKHLRKGQPIFAEGRLTLNSWRDAKTGRNRSRLLVTVESFQFVGKAAGDGGRGSQRRAAEDSTQETGRPAADDDDDDTIPF